MFPSFPTMNIAKRALRVLVSRNLGDFLECELALDQFEVGMNNLCITDAELKAVNINKRFEEFGIPFEFVRGNLAHIKFQANWLKILQAPSVFETNGLYIVLRPLPELYDDDDDSGGGGAGSMIESMLTSFNSMRNAQDILDEDGDGDQSEIRRNVGQEKLAGFIDKLITHLKVNFTNTTIRIEHILPDRDHGIALTIKIERLEYRNQTVREEATPPPTTGAAADGTDSADDDDEENASKTETNSFSTHNMRMEGFTFYMEEFRIADPNCESEKPAASTTASDHKPHSTEVMSDDGQMYKSLPEDYYDSAAAGNSSSREPRIEDATSTDDDDQDDSDSDDEDSQRLDEDVMHRTKPVMLAQLSGAQEVTIKLKQDLGSVGPRIQFDLKFGSLALFVTPRQLHFLNKFSELTIGMESRSADGASGGGGMLANRNSSRGSRYAPSSVSQQQQQYTNYGRHMFDSPYGHQPVTARRRYCDSESGFSQTTNTSMTASMCSSSVSTAERRGRRQTRRRNAPYEDPNVKDCTLMRLSVQCVTVVLLHDEVLVESVQDVPLLADSVRRQQRRADRFFAQLAKAQVLGVGDADMETATAAVERGCRHSHVRLVMAPIIVAVAEERCRKMTQLCVDAYVACADLREMLYSRGAQEVGLATPLLEFHPASDPETSSMKLTFKQCTYPPQTAAQSLTGRSTGPSQTTHINVVLQPCSTEVDVTMLDRVTALWIQSPYDNESEVSARLLRQARLAAAAAAAAPSRSKAATVDVQVHLTRCDAKLRFPCVDLRALDDPERRSWREKHVRPDFFLFQLSDVIAMSSSATQMDILAQNVDVFYYESAQSPRIEIAQASQLCKVNINIPPTAKLHPLRSTTVPDSVCTRIIEPLMAYTHAQSFTPFGIKREYRQTDTPHKKPSAAKPRPTSTRPSATTAAGFDSASETADANASADADSNETESLLPGNKAEMKNFIDAAIGAARVQVTLTLPVISAQIRSKHLLETLYNRINCDLLLWEPVQPAALEVADASAGMGATGKRASPLLLENDAMRSLQSTSMMGSSLMTAGMMDSMYAPFSMAKSDYESETDEAGPGDSIYLSVRDQRRKDSAATSNTCAAVESSQLCAMAFRLVVCDAHLTMFAPVRDSRKHVIPGQQGEFIVHISAVDMFSVSGYNGDPELGYVCLQVDGLQLYHCGLIPVPLLSPPLRPHGAGLPQHVHSTLYGTPKNLTPVHAALELRRRHQLSMAVEIVQSNEERVKRLRMALGIDRTTLRHNSCALECSWLMQLMDLFDLTDAIVDGYTPLSVVTELHFHLWDCSIDYRPLYLPYRTIITLGSIGLATNISMDTSGSTVRITAEDLILAMAPQRVDSLTPSGPSSAHSSPVMRHNSPLPPRSRSSSVASVGPAKITVLPASQLVCLVELSLFELSLRLNDLDSVREPQQDSRSTIVGLKLSTCADSCNALCQLVMYITDRCDLAGPDCGDDDEPVESSGLLANPRQQPVVPLISTADSATKSAAPPLTAAQHERVQSQIEEAMADSMYRDMVRPVANDDDDEDSSSAEMEALAALRTPQSAPAQGCDNDRVNYLFRFPDEKHAQRQRTQSECYGNGGGGAGRGGSGGNTSLSSVAMIADEANLDVGSVGSVTRHLLNFEQEQIAGTAALAAANADDLPAANAHVGDELGSIDEDRLSVAASQLSLHSPRPVSTGTIPKSTRLPVAAVQPKVLLTQRPRRTVNSVRYGPPEPKKPQAAGSDTDEEFIIVGEEERPGGGLDRLPVISPGAAICIVDNHFSVPVVETDLLQAPAGFPTPVQRDTLCELSAQWHMYGGQDFETSPMHSGRYTSRVAPTTPPTPKCTSPYTATPTSTPSKSHHHSRTNQPHQQHHLSGEPMTDVYRSGVSYTQGVATIHIPNAAASRTGSPSATPTKPPPLSAKEAQTAARLWRQRGGPHRRIDVHTELNVDRLRFRYEKYPRHVKQITRQVLIVRRVEIIDRMACSEIKKFLYLHDSELSKKNDRNMFVLKLLRLRPEPTLKATECSLCMSMLPLRVNVDQDTATFMLEFAQCLFNDGVPPGAGVNRGRGGGGAGAAKGSMPPGQRRRSCSGSSATGAGAGSGTYHSDPVMMIREMEGGTSELRQRKTSGGARKATPSEKDDLLLSDSDVVPSPTQRPAKRRTTSVELVEEEADVFEDDDADAPIYFRTIEFCPAVTITIDYYGKRVEMSRGLGPGLLMGLGQLQSTQITLKKINYRKGILGVDKLLEFLKKEWSDDIRRNQVGSVLRGVGTFTTLEQLYTAITDLVWLPVQQYRLDGCIGRGLQLGFTSFFQNTMSSVFSVLLLLVDCMQRVSEAGYDMVSPGMTSAARHRAIGAGGGGGGGGQLGRRRNWQMMPYNASMPQQQRRIAPAQDIREGMVNAMAIICDGLGEPVVNMLEAAALERDQKGMPGAVGAVLRHIPPTIMHPFVLATQATSNVLGGVRNQMLPEQRRDEKQKYKDEFEE